VRVVLFPLTNKQYVPDDKPICAKAMEKQKNNVKPPKKDLICIYLIQYHL